MSKKDMKIQKRENNSKLIVMSLFAVFLTFIIFVSLVSFASAEFWQCFSHGQKVDYCGSVQDRTAPTDNYRLCMDSFNAAQNCYVPGNWNVCNTLTPGCAINGSGSLDITPPVINLINPTNGSLNPGRSVTLDIQIDERSSIYMLDVVNGRNRWSRLCTNCMSYNRARSFKDGMNVIRFRATDGSGNEGFFDVTFFVDSQKPRIHGTEPKRGFANGFFDVSYTETNVNMVNLTYGNALTGFTTTNLGGCPSGVKVHCNTSVNLNAYNGQEITYQFAIKDNAGSVVSSRIVKMDVDTVAPVLNNMNYTIDGRSVNFMFNVTEDNLDVIQYMDLTESRPRFRSLCTRLVDGACSKKASFRSGHHDLIIEILDDAGSKVQTSASFDIA